MSEAPEKCIVPALPRKPLLGNPSWSESAQGKCRQGEEAEGYCATTQRRQRTSQETTINLVVLSDRSSPWLRRHRDARPLAKPRSTQRRKRRTQAKEYLLRRRPRPGLWRSVFRP